MPLHILSHPLAAHIITHLRDKTTKPATFRTLAYQISLLLAIEATSEIESEEKQIETPLETITGRVLTHQPLVVVPILRAGLGMLQPFTDLFPDVSVGYIGLERDHVTAQARSYYCKLPPLAGRHVFAVDPMLATGGSAAQALTVLKENGAVDPALVCIVSSPRRRRRSGTPTPRHRDPHRSPRPRPQREKIHPPRPRRFRRPPLRHVRCASQTVGTALRSRPRSRPPD
jgi:uracil phosphoribosyltransferase